MRIQLLKKEKLLGGKTNKFIEKKFKKTKTDKKTQHKDRNEKS